MTRSQKLLIFIIFQSVFLGVATNTHAIRISCNDSLVDFEYEQPGDLKCLCATAKLTIDFLQSIGLETTERITIKVVARIPSSENYKLIGSYNAKTKEVSILSYLKTVELSQEKKQIFGITLNEELWCSYAAHELAHVISSQYINPKVPAHTAGEYISTVTQLMVLSAPVREKILARYNDINAYKTRAEMSEIYYLFAPNQFAVKCYLHFMSLEKPSEFIDQLTKEKKGN